MSNRQSNNDIKFNTLLASSSYQKTNDLNVSTISSHKEHQGTSKNIIPTSTYLQQIDDKYHQMYQDKKEKKQMKDKKHNHQQPSHIDNTQINNNIDIPAKFRQSNIQQPQIIQQEQQIKSQIIQPQMNDTISPLKAPVLNIPNDISLSRGVSERGFK